MTSSLAGALVLFGLGAAFSIAGVLGVVARRTGDLRWRPGRPAILVDLLVGVAATAEAASGIAEVSPRAVLWSVGSAVLVVAVVVLTLSRALRPRPTRAPGDAAGIGVGPLSSG